MEGRRGRVDWGCWCEGGYWEGEDVGVFGELGSSWWLSYWVSVLVFGDLAVDDLVWFGGGGAFRVLIR